MYIISGAGLSVVDVCLCVCVCVWCVVCVCVCVCVGGGGGEGCVYRADMRCIKGERDSQILKTLLTGVITPCKSCRLKQALTGDLNKSNPMRERRQWGRSIVR